MEDLMMIKAESRSDVGKKFAKQLRRQGKVPAIIYGEHKESIPISIALSGVKAILKSERGENTVLKIQRDDMEVDAMLKEVQYDYLSDNIIHADFLRIDLSKPVLIRVPVATKGLPIGVKLEDGIFDFITREIQVKCLATQIPRELEIDISGLHAGHSIKAEDLELGEGVKLISDPNRVICAVMAKSRSGEETVEEVAPEAAAEPPAAKKEESTDKK
jgi:large subunit ribosomal protein L25